MIRDITLGQYYPAKSVIHQLDPRVKLVTTVIYVISLFVANGIAGYAVATLFLGIVIKLSKVPFKYITKGLKAIVLLLVLTAVFNLFLIDGEIVLWRWGIFRITDQGIRTAVFMAIRLIYLIIGSSVMTLTTTPNDLTDGLEKLLGPLKRVRVPVHEIAMMMSIALRFIPILLEETDKIMKAQKARAMVPLLVPLFISAFRRANDLAMAMEARCYHGGDGRTKMKPLHYESKDKTAYGVVCCYLIVMILVGRYFT